jgi:hypothetical protein
VFTIVSPNRNRVDSLAKVLPSWQRVPSIAQIVIVDFGSEPPIALQHFASPAKIKIIRVTNSAVWRIGLAINIGCDFANEARIVKLDSDIEIRDASCLQAWDLGAAFYRGHHSGAVSNGQAVFAQRHWRAVGGYNEWLSGYGFDDSDFYGRLRRSGIVERRLEDGFLVEHRHGNESRAPGPIQTEFVSAEFATDADRILYLLSKNTYLAMLREWGAGLRVGYSVSAAHDGSTQVMLHEFTEEYRWADALANLLAVVRLSGTEQNVHLLNRIVAAYLAASGGL